MVQYCPMVTDILLHEYQPLTQTLTLTYCCYDHRTFTATAVVGCHRTNTTIAVF